MIVAAIYTYPIKSLRGCTPPSLTATPTGFNYDRRFMLQHVNEDGQIENMHVSTYTEMCLFTTELVCTKEPDSHSAQQPDLIRVRYTQDHVFDHPEQKLEGDVERMALEIPLEPDIDTTPLEEVAVDMHGSPCTGYAMGSRYDDWFSRRFGYQVRLLYIGRNRRKVLGSVNPAHESHHQANGAQSSDSVYTGWLSGIRANVSAAVAWGMGSTTHGIDDSSQIKHTTPTDARIGFADCAPFLIINTKSWENASQRLCQGEELDISKFRPNIVVHGDEAFEEDFWAELLLGHDDDCTSPGKRIILTANCARCNSLNVDYTTGKVGTGEAGKIFKKLQKDRRVDLGMKYSPVFGRYGFLAFAPGAAGREMVEINVGDPVSVVRKNEERTRFQWPNLSTDK